MTTVTTYHTCPTAYVATAPAVYVQPSYPSVTTCVYPTIKTIAPTVTTTTTVQRLRTVPLYTYVDAPAIISPVTYYTSYPCVTYLW